MGSKSKVVQTTNSNDVVSETIDDIKLSDDKEQCNQNKINITNIDENLEPGNNEDTNLQDYTQAFIEYHAFCERSIQSYFLWLLNKIIGKIRSSGNEVNYYAFLTNQIDDLDNVAEQMKAKELDLFSDIIPISKVRFINNTYGATKDNYNGAASNSIYEFTKTTCSPSYLGILTMINSESGSLGQSSIPFVVAKNIEEGKKLIHSYNIVSSKIRGTKNCIFNINGEIISNFETKKWTDIVLPKNLLYEIRNDIDNFFNNKDIYKKKGIEYKRKIMLSGPIGNGKTSLCRAVASNSKFPVFYGTIESFESPTALKDICNKMSCYSPCIVIVEDLDSSIDDEMQSIAFNLLDITLNFEGLFLIITTNFNENNNLSMKTNKFDSFYLIKNPEKKEILTIINKIIGKQVVDKLPKDQFILLIDEMYELGLSYASVQEVIINSLISSKDTKHTTIKSLRQSLKRVVLHINNSKIGTNGITTIGIK